MQVRELVEVPNRIIRPGINSSDRVDALSAGAEVFYRRLMSAADDYGRFDGDWRVLRSALYPKKTDQITMEHIEQCISECSTLLPTEQEPLLLIYYVHNRRYLQITNFGQQVRALSKFPDPVSNHTQALAPQAFPKAPASNGLHLKATRARTHSCNDNEHDYEHDNEHDNEHGKNRTEKIEPEHSAKQLTFDVDRAFEVLVAAYPANRRHGLKTAKDQFRRIVETGINAGKTGADVCREIHTGLKRWQMSELWNRQKIHSLTNWLAGDFWAEYPVPGEQGRPTLAEAIEAGKVSTYEEYQALYGVKAK